MFVILIVAIIVVVAASANVRMEPSVNVFSSNMWLKEPKPLNENDQIKMIFVLKHDSNKIKKFEHTLLDLSTPTSANYAKWLKVN